MSPNEPAPPALSSRFATRLVSESSERDKTGAVSSIWIRVAPAASALRRVSCTITGGAWIGVWFAGCARTSEAARMQHRTTERARFIDEGRGENERSRPPGANAEFVSDPGGGHNLSPDGG